MKKIIASTLVVLVLASGCSWFEKAPQKAVDDGVANLGGIEKMSSSLTLSGTIRAPEGEKPEKVDFTLTVTGKSDVSDDEAPKADVKFALNASADQLQAGGELLLRAADKKVFASLAKLDLPGDSGAEAKEQLGSLLNVWWEMPSEEGNPLGNVTEQQKLLQEKFKTTKFFTNATEEGMEEVGGMPATKFRVELNKEAVTQFILDLARSEENALSPEEEIAVGDRVKELEFAGAVWVGEDDIVHRIKGTVTIQPKQGPSTSFEVDFSGWDYGKDVEVAAPESAQEFNPFMLLPVFGALSSLSQESAAEPSPEPLGAEQVK